MAGDAVAAAVVRAHADVVGGASSATRLGRGALAVRRNMKTCPLPALLTTPDPDAGLRGVSASSKKLHARNTPNFFVVRACRTCAPIEDGAAGRAVAGTSEIASGFGCGGV